MVISDLETPLRSEIAPDAAINTKCDREEENPLQDGGGGVTNSELVGGAAVQKSQNLVLNHLFEALLSLKIQFKEKMTSLRRSEAAEMLENGS